MKNLQSIINVIIDKGNNAEDKSPESKTVNLSSLSQAFSESTSRIDKRKRKKTDR